MNVEFNKYQSLKRATNEQEHLLALVSAVGNIADYINTNQKDIDELTVLLGTVLEHTTGIATTNNLTLDTVAGINLNQYRNHTHMLVGVGDDVMYNGKPFKVYDVIGEQVLIANDDHDLVVNLYDVSV